MMRCASLTLVYNYACRCHGLRLSAFNKETTCLLAYFLYCFSFNFNFSFSAFSANKVTNINKTTRQHDCDGLTDIRIYPDNKVSV